MIEIKQKRFFINNAECSEYAKELKSFTASNLSSELNDKGWYVVSSYEWYPIAAWSSATGWIGVLEPYSNSTARHIRQLGMHDIPLYTSGVMRWMLDHDADSLPKPPKKTGRHYLSIEARMSIIDDVPHVGYWDLPIKERVQIRDDICFNVLTIPDTHHYYPLLETQDRTSTDSKTGMRSRDAKGFLSVGHYTDITEKVNEATDIFGDYNVKRCVYWGVVKKRFNRGSLKIC